MNTGKEYLDVLSKRQQELWKINYNNEEQDCEMSDFLSKEFKGIYTFIVSSFTWFNTPEPGLFWSDLACRDVRLQVALNEVEYLKEALKQVETMHIEEIKELNQKLSNFTYVEGYSKGALIGRETIPPKK